MISQSEFKACFPLFSRYPRCAQGASQVCVPLAPREDLHLAGRDAYAVGSARATLYNSPIGERFWNRGPLWQSMESSLAGGRRVGLQQSMQREQNSSRCCLKAQ